jgi:hypothetical protein
VSADCCGVAQEARGIAANRANAVFLIVWLSDAAKGQFDDNLPPTG